MATSFDDSQAERLRFYYEKLPYTSLIASLPVASSPIFSANNVGAATNDENMAILSELAVTPTAQLYVATTGETSTRNMATLAFPPTLGAVMNDEVSGSRSTGYLGLSLTNNTGAAIANVQTNYAIAVKKLSTADKVLRGLTLTPDDEEWKAKFGISNNGVRPHSIRTTLERAFFNRVISEEVYAESVNLAANALTPILNLTTRSGELLIVRSIASNAPVGNQVMLNVSRDRDANYCQVLADNMSLTNPLDCWIPAQNTLSISGLAVTATNPVNVRLSLLRLQMSTVLRAMFGQLKPSQLDKADLTLYEQVMAGVLV